MQNRKNTANKKLTRKGNKKKKKKMEKQVNMIILEIQNQCKLKQIQTNENKLKK